MDDALKEQVSELHKFNLDGRPGFIRWACFIDGKIKKMNSRPCYGEMRSYGRGSTRPQDSKPYDLPSPMPIGGKRGPLALSLYDHSVPNDFIRWAFDPENSPWRRGIAKDVEFTENARGQIVGVVYPTPDVDPTVMLSLFINGRSFPYTQLASIKRLSPELSDPEAYFLSFFFTPVVNLAKELQGCSTYHLRGYSLSGDVDLRAWFTGETIDLSNNRTWLEGEDYNRPNLADVFKGKDAENFINWAKMFIPAAKTTPDDYKCVVGGFHQRYQKEFAK